MHDRSSDALAPARGLLAGLEISLVLWALTVALVLIGLRAVAL